MTGPKFTPAVIAVGIEARIAEGERIAAGRSGAVRERRRHDTGVGELVAAISRPTGIRVTIAG